MAFWCVECEFSQIDLRSRLQVNTVTMSTLRKHCAGCGEQTRHVGVDSDGRPLLAVD